MENKNSRNNKEEITIISWQSVVLKICSCPVAIVLLTSSRFAACLAPFCYLPCSCRAACLARLSRCLPRSCGAACLTNGLTACRADAYLTALSYFCFASNMLPDLLLIYFCLTVVLFLFCCPTCLSVSLPALLLSILPSCLSFSLLTILLPSPVSAITLTYTCLIPVLLPALPGCLPTWLATTLLPALHPTFVCQS